MIGRWHWHCSCQNPWFPVVHAWASVEFGPVKISAWQTAGNQRPRKFPWEIHLSISNQQPANQQHFAVSFLQFFFKLSWYCFPRFPKLISQRFHVHMLMPQNEFRLRSFQSEGQGLPRKVMTGYWNASSSSNHWTTWGVDIHRIPNIDDSPLRLIASFFGEKLLGEKSDFFDWKKHHVDKRHIQAQSARINMKSVL